MYTDLSAVGNKETLQKESLVRKVRNAILVKS